MYLSNPHGAQLGSSKEGQVGINDDEANDTFRAWVETRNNYVLESDGAAAVRGQARRPGTSLNSE